MLFFLAKDIRKRLTILLTGLSISLTSGAIIQLLVLHAPEKMDDYLLFLAGSLYGVRGETVTLVFLIAMIATPLAFMLGKRFSVLSLDDCTCRSLGVSLLRYQLIAFFVAALLIGSSIVGIGHLGFLGIVAPNLARQIIGDRPHYVFPLAFLIGSFMYLVADILGRSILSPVEIPAGMVTNLISAPLFLFVLFHSSRQS